MSIAHLSISLSQLVSSFATIINKSTNIVANDASDAFQPSLDIMDSITSELDLASVLPSQTLEQQDSNYQIYPTSNKLSTPSATKSIPISCNSNFTSINSPISETLTSTPTSCSESESVPMTQLIFNLTSIEEDVIYAQHGYKKLSKIGDTSQGELIKSKNTTNNTYVTIKKCSKGLLSDRITFADNCDMHFICDDDICKEAKILQYLTMHNTPSTDCIVTYIDFYESEEDFYLVTEYTNGMTLQQFVETAFKYICNNQLEIKQYQKVIKYIFWQICAGLHWLHHDMHCCHLNLTMETIILVNAEFIDSDGSITINPLIEAKFTDFSKSEVFQPKDNKFRCMKYDTTDHVQYLCPKVYDEDIYDARKADMWCLGMILLNAVVGEPLYTEIDFFEIEEPSVGGGYWAVMTHNIKSYLSVHGLLQYTNNKMLKIIYCLLNTNDKKRMNTLQMLESLWFASYHRRYFSRIEKKSIVQKRQLIQQQKEWETFPYYFCPY